MSKMKKTNKRIINYRSTIYDKAMFALLATKAFGVGAPIDRTEVSAFCKANSLPFPTWFLNGKKHRARNVDGELVNGKYSIPILATYEKYIKQDKIKPGDIPTDEMSQKVYDNDVAPQLNVDQEEKSVVVSPKTLAVSLPKIIEYPTKTESRSTTWTAVKDTPMPYLQTTTSLIPMVNQQYVAWGEGSEMIDKVIKSKMFYPIYITGLTGNGKTLMVEQLCAVNNRELVRVNITCDTDETDLFGGFRLVNGNTEWQDGPVTIAMKRNAILLFDEVDLGSSRIMCLQPVLEGKPILLKKTGEMVYPGDGFNIIATANTRGRGSADIGGGRYIGTNILNEAFLDRFAITIEQEYPTIEVETEILKRVGLGEEQTKILTDWAARTRAAHAANDAVSDVISTRRLVDIAKGFGIFGDLKKSVENCLRRFDGYTASAFRDLFDALVKNYEELNSPKPGNSANTKTEAFGYVNPYAKPGDTIFQSAK